MPTSETRGFRGKRRTDAEIEAAATQFEQLADQLDLDTVVAVPGPGWKDRPRPRVGYPAGSKLAAEQPPQPASTTLPATDAENDQ